MLKAQRAKPTNNVGKNVCYLNDPIFSSSRRDLKERKLKKGAIYLPWKFELMGGCSILFTFLESRCFAQANLHSIQRVFPILPYTFTAHKTFYFYANYFLPVQITFFYANLLQPTFSKENSIRGRHARQMNKLQESSLDTKIGKVSIERNRTALPGAPDELIV